MWLQGVTGVTNNNKKINYGNFSDRNDIRLQLAGTRLYNTSFRYALNKLKTIPQTL